MADSLYSVFQKFCPQCTASVSRDADHCDCGYSFNGDNTGNGESSLAQAIAEEKLYEDYLQARVTQTAQAAIAAQTAHQKKPDDGMFALAARNAMEEAERCRAELAAQSEKVAEMERALEAEHHRPHGTTSVATPALTPSAHIEPLAVTITPVAAVDLPLKDIPATTITLAPAAKPAPTPKTPIAAPIMAKAPAKAPAPKPSIVSSPAAPTSVAAAVTEMPSDSTHNVTHVHQPARVLKPNLTERVTNAAEALRAELAQMRNGREATPRKIATEATTSTPRAEVPVVAAPVIAKPVPSRPTTTMPTAPIKPVQEILAHANSIKKEKREAAQAAKAQKIRDARLARQAQRPAAPPKQATAAESSVAATAETPPMQQPAVAAPVPKPAVAVAAPVLQTKECANCTAAVALLARRCKCGYEFPDSAQVTMPALALDPTEVATVVDLYSRRR